MSDMDSSTLAADTGLIVVVREMMHAWLACVAGMRGWHAWLACVWGASEPPTAGPCLAQHSGLPRGRFATPFATRRERTRIIGIRQE